MTRQDYILIAEAIREANITDDARAVVARAIARALNTTNTRFDFGRFMQAASPANPF